MSEKANRGQVHGRLGGTKNIPFTTRAACKGKRRVEGAAGSLNGLA